MRTSTFALLALATASLLLLPLVSSANAFPVQIGAPWDVGGHGLSATHFGGTGVPLTLADHGPRIATSETPENACAPLAEPAPTASSVQRVPGASRIIRSSQRSTAPGTLVESTVIERDGEYYLRERRRITEWEWNFPSYVGNLGMQFGRFAQVSEKNAFAGMYYRHLHSKPGPLFYGFELSPFNVGAIFDRRYAAIYSFHARALFVLRLYLDVAKPGIYFELASGPQFTAFRTADNFAKIYENGYERDTFYRWRAATRLAFGLEFGVVGLEIGWTGIFPTIEFEYNVNTVTHEVAKATIGSYLYVGATFRFASSD